MIVFISARVHSGESPSSFVMKGILKFLLNKKDIRAKILREHFVFKVVPMVNPDGVHDGHYRMDVLNQNLNRFYKDPHHETTPAPFAIKELFKYYQQQNRLFYYCDLHGHPNRKGMFIYGNAYKDYLQQVET